MSLPFEKDNKRKYQCFCCGRAYDSYEEMKQHILEKHEEGRDYVLCPLPRCSFPVRDVKLHFKNRHPTDPMPRTGQLKALIWKDQRTKGKLKTRKPKFREGYLVSIKNNGKEFFYRSGYECQVFECLELIPEVIAYDVEPFKQGIPYLFDGEPRTYHPDILIKYNDGKIEVWEIKPSNQTALGVNQAKWAAAEIYCNNRGWTFVVVTEQGIAKLKRRATETQLID
jgi:hypothetical protein